MKALILDGFEEASGIHNKVMNILMQGLKEKSTECERIILSEKQIGYCKACFGCWFVTPGKCVVKDAVDEITAKIVQSDLVVFFSPVVLGGYSPRLKVMLDRLAGLVLPTFVKMGDAGYHHKKRYAENANLLGIGIMDEYNEEEEENFKSLVYRNSYNYHAALYDAIVISPKTSENDVKSSIATAVQRLGGLK